MTGAEFKAIRKSFSLTQRQLADKMGYSRRETIAELEAMDEVPGNVAASIRTQMLLHGVLLALDRTNQ